MDHSYQISLYLAQKKTLSEILIFDSDKRIARFTLMARKHLKFKRQCKIMLLTSENPQNVKEKRNKDTTDYSTIDKYIIDHSDKILSFESPSIKEDNLLQHRTALVHKIQKRQVVSSTCNLN